MYASSNYPIWFLILIQVIWYSPWYPGTLLLFASIYVSTSNGFWRGFAVGVVGVVFLVVGGVIYNTIWHDVLRSL